MDTGVIWTIIGASATVLATLYTFLRNFKLDMLEQFVKIDSKINEFKNDLGKRIDDQSKRIDLLDAKIDKNEANFNAKIEKVESSLNAKIEPIQHAIIDINTRLYGIEMILKMKDCCMIKDERQLKKAE